MRAVVLRSYNLEGLHFVRNHPMPTIRNEHDVLVKIKACGLSDLDLQVRKGHHSDLPGLSASSQHRVLGFEISGVVTMIGSEVKTVAVGDEVVGISPLDSPCGGYAEYTVFRSHEVVRKSQLVSHEDAAGAVRACVRAITAIHYQMHLVAGETVLVLNGASANGHVAVQLAAGMGLRVITTAEEEEESDYLNDLQSVQSVRIVYPKREDLAEVVMEETGGLGVEGIIEDTWPYARNAHGFQQQQQQQQQQQLGGGALEAAQGAQGDFGGSDVTHYHHNHNHGAHHGSDGFEGERGDISHVELIKCLAVHGKWVSADPSLSLDPRLARLLYLKGATVSFLFDQAWVLSSAQQGRYLHVLTEALERLQAGQVKPKIAKTFPLEKIREAHRNLEITRVGKIVIKP